MFNSGSPAPSCTKFPRGPSVKFNSVDKQMKTKFNILMACRDGFIQVCVISPLCVRLFVFVIEEVPFTKHCAQEPWQTLTHINLWTCGDFTLDNSFKSGPNIISQCLQPPLQKNPKNIYLNVYSQLWYRLDLQENRKTNHQVLHSCVIM